MLNVAMAHSMKNLNDALKLAEKMVDIGTKAGRKVSAVISDMNEPLGCGGRKYD